MPNDVFTTLASYMSAAYFTQEIAASLLSVLAALALTLSAIGRYGLIADSVARRRREIGVRMALGATDRDILALVLSRGLALVGAGMAAGAVLTALSARALSSLLFGVGPLDAAVLASAGAVLIAISGLASYIPGRAAARTDPNAALRAD